MEANKFTPAMPAKQRCYYFCNPIPTNGKRSSVHYFTFKYMCELPNELEQQWCVLFNEKILAYYSLVLMSWADLADYAMSICLLGIDI